MVRRLLLPLMTVTILASAAWVVASPSTTTTAAVTLDPEEQAFMTLLNDYRVANGGVPLDTTDTLQNAAEWMSNDMGVNNYFSHTDSLGRSPGQRMTAFGYNFNTWRGENIAAGFTTAQSVFTAWQNSSGHNANMLNVNYRVMGIARVYVAGSTYGYYWTNDFGGFNPNPSPPAGTGTPTPVTTATPTPTTAPTATPTPAPTATPSPSPTPNPASDSDGDGFSAAEEQAIGTSPTDSCGEPDTGKPGSPSRSWAADLASTGASANRIDVTDISSFITPLRRLGTSPGDAAFDVRWDIVPGYNGLTDQINMLDLTQMVIFTVPNFGNQRAFGGQACTG